MNLRRSLLAALTLLLFVALRAAEPFPHEKIDYPAFALRSVPIGHGNAFVLCPEKPAAGKPWVLAPSFYDVRNPAVANMTRTQLALVRRGFHVVCAGPSVVLGAPDPQGIWDSVYREMTRKYGLSQHVALMGVSREGLPMARWAAANPGKVSCLYLDKAVCDFKSWPGGKLGLGKGSPKDWQSLLEVYRFASEAEALAFTQNPVDLAPKLAADNVAIIYLTGAKDDVVPYAENGARMKAHYDTLGGTFTLIRREAEGHHPHGLDDPTPVVDFIASHSLYAFNALAAASGSPERKISEADIRSMVQEQKIPAALASETQTDPERQKPVLFRRIASQARITVFEGGHDSEPAAAIAWLARQRRGQAADFTLGSAAASAAEAVGK